MNVTAWLMLANAVDRRPFYVTVAQEARVALSTLAAGQVISTSALVEMLCPLTAAMRGDEITSATAARKAIVNVLLAKGKRQTLEDCRAQGPAKPKRYMGHVVHPWQWHAPPTLVPKLCPHCGGAL